jgi:predicted PurR-regulated permease PerM
VRPDEPAPPVSRSSAGLDGVLRTTALVAAGVVLLWLLHGVVLLIFFAALLGATLRGAADWLAHRFGWRPKPVLAVLTLLLVLIAAGIAVGIGPSLSQQGGDLVTHLTDEAQALRDRYGNTEWGKRILAHVQGGGEGGGAGAIAQPAIKVLGMTTEFLADLVLLVITALYFAISPELYVGGLLRLVPIRHRPRAAIVLRESGRNMRRWLLGQMVDMLAVAVLTALGLSVLGVPVPLALGVLAGLLTFIPYFGAVLAAVPAVLVALSAGPQLALWVLGVFVLVHLVEGYVISPLVQRRLVEMPPAVTVLSMTAGGTLFGPLGIMLGTPIAAALMVVVREVYVADILGDDDVRTER